MKKLLITSIPNFLEIKANARILSLLFILFITCDVQAQFYPYNPYNPYMNPGYQAGQQLGNAIAQRSKYGRNQLRKAIKKWGECNNGTLSLEHGAVALYGSNGNFWSAAVDDRISSKLKSINKNGGTINDVNITENGNFIVVFNDKEWYGVLPSGLKSALDEYSYGTKFKSISFNESGTYAITTSDGFKSNNSIYQSFYDENVDDYGEYNIYTANETTTAWKNIELPLTFAGNKFRYKLYGRVCTGGVFVDNLRLYKEVWQTSISDAAVQNETSIGIYRLDGTQISSLNSHRGINIVRQPNGTVIKTISR